MTLMEHLLNLFRVDAQVRGLRSRLDQAERYLAAQQSKLAAVTRQKDELETRRRQMKAKVGNAETEIASLNQRIEKLRNELNASATNKQYTALLSEINTFKAAKAEMESAVLADMETVEKLSSEIDSLETQAAERVKHRDLAKVQLEERLGDVSERLAELESERAQAAALVPEQERRIFDELSDNYAGEALACIEVIDRRNREYACGSCNMHVPFETVSALMNAGTALVRCTVCKRILFIQEETRGSLVKK
jgi:predicted  nucleic acid-binding Zn-ribbon protein